MGSSPVTPTKKLCECKSTRIFIYVCVLCYARTCVHIYKKRHKDCAELLELELAEGVCTTKFCVPKFVPWNEPLGEYHETTRQSTSAEFLELV